MTPDEKRNIIIKYQQKELNASYEGNVKSSVDMLSRLMIFSIANVSWKKLVYFSIHQSPRIDIEVLLNTLKQESLSKVMPSWSGAIEYFTCLPITLPEQVALVQTAGRQGLNLRIFAYDAILKEPMLAIMIEKKDDFEYNGINQLQRGIYEILAYGAASTNIKQRLVESYILHSLYDQNCVSTPREQLIKVISAQSKFSKEDIDNTISSLILQKTIGKDPDNKKNIRIEEAGKLKVMEAKSIASNEEASFKKDLSVICEEHNIRVPIDNVITHIKDLAFDTYNGILNHREPSEERVEKFESYLKSIYASDIAICTQKIRVLCQNNPFISRVCIGEVYIDNVKSKEIENYTKNAKKTIYLDTPVIIYWICYWAFHGNQETDWENSRYQATRDLMDILLKNTDEIQVCVSYSYLKEVAGEVQKALRLQVLEDAKFPVPFSTHNTFYQYYQFIKTEKCFTSFIQFLNAITIPTNNSDNIRYTDILAGVFAKRINESYPNIYIDKNIDCHEDIEKEIKIKLPNTYLENRNEASLYHDISLLTKIQYLYQKNRDNLYTHYFVTSWDHIFEDIREKIQENDPGFSCYLSSPTQLASQLAMAHFSLTSGILSNAMFITADTKDAIQNLYDNALTRLMDSIESPSLNSIQKLLEAQNAYMLTNFHDWHIEDLNELQKYPLENVINSVFSNVIAWGGSSILLRKYFNDEEQFDIIKSDLEAGYDEIKAKKNYRYGDAIKVFEEHFKSWVKKHPEADSLGEGEEGSEDDE